MKPDEHLYIKAELTTEDHDTAAKFLRDMLATLEGHESNPDKPFDGTWSSVQGSAAMTIEVRKDKEKGPTC